MSRKLSVALTFLVTFLCQDKKVTGVWGNALLHQTIIPEFYSILSKAISYIFA
jgi:hypothetical protein